MGLEGGSNTCYKSQGQHSSRFAGTVSIILNININVGNVENHYDYNHSLRIVLRDDTAIGG